MKKTVFLILLLMLALVMCACGNGNMDNVTESDTVSVDTPMIQEAPLVFQSFEAYEQYEQRARSAGSSCYYIPSSVPDEYELIRITKREDVYVMVEYQVPTASLDTEGLDEYALSRLQTLICRYSLYEDGSVALQQTFANNGYQPMEYNGKTYYRWDEYENNDSTKRLIGYEIAFLEDGQLIFMHLPAIDTFENMMKHADVIKVTIS